MRWRWAAGALMICDLEPFEFYKIPRCAAGHHVARRIDAVAMEIANSPSGPGADLPLPDHPAPSMFPSESVNTKAEAYARKLVAEAQSPSEDRRIRAEVDRLAQTLQPVVAGAGLGRCQDVCFLASHMLLSRNVPNVIMAGSVVLRDANGAYLEGHHAIDIIDTGTTTGHFWLLAPPYRVIDLTIAHQWVTVPWKVPEQVLLDAGHIWTNYIVQREDLAAPRVLQTFDLPMQPYQEFASTFGVCTWRGDGQLITYVAVQPPTSTVPLAEWNDYLNLGMKPVDYVANYSRD